MAINGTISSVVRHYVVHYWIQLVKCQVYRRNMYSTCGFVSERYDGSTS